jgi:cell division protein FtsW (lipid II flippase)
MIPALTPHLLIALSKPEHPSFLSILVKIVAATAVLMIAPELGTLVLAGLTAEGITFISGMVVDAVMGGMLDAGAQGIEIAAHLQKGFSVTEMVQTSLTVGLSPASATAGTLEIMKGAAEVNVLTQLTAMASGQVHSLDVRQLITTVAKAGAAAKIKSYQHGSR